MSDRSLTADDRQVSLGEGLASIPERLLLAHARGEVLFIVGAGVSQQANLPDFRGLVLKVYERLDRAVHGVISLPPGEDATLSPVAQHDLSPPQLAEIKRFYNRDYDVVLGMLERRMDVQPQGNSSVRKAIADELRRPARKPASIHRALMRLADRGGPITIVTTNFDLLLEAAHKRGKPALQTYALGGIPRPGRRGDFSGVLHIHGALDRDPLEPVIW